MWPDDEQLFHFPGRLWLDDEQLFHFQEGYGLMMNSCSISRRAIA